MIKKIAIISSSMKKIQFLKPLISFLLIGLTILTTSRFLLFLFFESRVIETPDYGFIFPIGLRMDLIVLCYLLFLPVALIALVPDSYLQKIQSFFTVYFVLFLSLILFMELATLDFIKEYDTRPNSLFIDYLIYPQEVVGTLLKSYMSSIVIAMFVVTGFVYTLIRFRKPLFEIRLMSYKTKLKLFPLIAFFCVFWCKIESYF